MDLDRFATTLLRIADEQAEAVRPIDRRLATATLSGACHAFAALAGGAHPDLVRHTVMELVEAFPRPQATADNRDRKARHAVVHPRMVERLAELAR